MSTNALITNTAVSSGTTSPHLSQSSDPVQTGSKRRWSSENQSAPGISCSSDQSPLSEKRPRLLMRSGDGTLQTAYTFWLAFDVITAGRQGVELGRDQAPVVQISAVLGKFSEAEAVDRFTVNIRPESFVRPQNGSTETNPLPNPGEQSGPNISEEYTHWLQTATNLTNGFYENVLHNSQTPDPTHEPGATTCMVPISLDAMKAAHWEDASQLPSYNSPSLPEAMNMIISWLQGHSVPVGEDPEQSALIVITEGHVQLRNVLQPQAAYLGIDRALMHRTPWCLYVSILDWCRQALEDQTGTDSASSNKRITNLMEAMTALEMDTNQDMVAADVSLNKAEQIARLINILSEKGVPVCEPQIIRSVYEHKVFPKTISLEDSCVVEVRQVPWSATPSIIAGFFTGLNLIPGGVAIRLTDGRRSNTAIVAFTSSLNAQLALARHQHQFCGALFPESPQDTQQGVDRAGTKDKQAQTPTKPSTLQVYSASAREFIQCAGCDQPLVSEFLSQLTNGEQVVVRVRGLPFTATKQQILDFFKAVEAPVLLEANGIYLVAYPEGRPTGDAFVLFSDDKTATRALLRHKDYLGDRYVELFKASPSEMVQVCHNVSKQLVGSHSSQKLPGSSADQQVRTRSAINLAASSLPTLAPYVLQSPSVSAALASMKPPGLGLNALSSVPLQTNFLSPGLLQLGLRPSFLPTLDQLTTANLSLPLTNMLPAQLLGQTHLLNTSSVPTTSLGVMTMPSRQLTETATKDLKDPTDPDCPYARQLPVAGVTAMIQMSGLPLETSRHDIRLYLGPVNMAKVYRMRQMDPKPDQTTSTWLISVSNTIEAIHLIRDLVNRPFSLTNGSTTGVARVIPNVPTFSLYHVGADKSVVPALLSDPSFGIPLNRIYGVAASEPVNGESWTSSPLPNTQLTDTGQLLLKGALTESTSRALEMNSNLVNATRLPEAVNNQMVQNLLCQTTLMNAHKSVTKPQPSLSAAIAGTALQSAMAGGYRSLASPGTQLLPGGPGQVFYQLQQNHFNPAANLSSVGGSDPGRTPSWTTVGGIMNPASTVMLTGAPLNATTEELMSLFQPISHWLSTTPQFTLYQPQPNGTANFLATFNNPVEAQTAALCCPSGSLRNRQYVIGAACLVPNPVATVAPTGQPTTLLDPTTSGYNQLNPAANLMLFSSAMTNPSLF
ncbi:epithelial splicing regulatory protein 1 [Clonorchis sinensis]|uniref:Epithelial splicing regulatory protein 1 n=1 Tax=Clonorchis sinensis TaxID=79923 RepID=G7YKR8_CLOSI|nr:epithelial splicing regulatory protein 1 [Clonorchis sinensis]